MEPVQFQCGHCGKLMAVGAEHLGQQVRCPHCQQIVIAPPPSSPPNVETPPRMVETTLHVPAPSGDAEDIFSSTEVSDDLFGRSEPPRVEMPPEPIASTLAGDNAAPQPQPEATLSSTLPFGGPKPSPSPSDGTAVLPSSEPAQPWLAPTETLPLPPMEAPSSFPTETPAAAETVARPPRRTEPKVPWFMLLVFSPLLLYALVITVFSLLLYRQYQDLDQQLHKYFEQFEVMPDEGDRPGVQPPKGKKVSRQWQPDAKRPFRSLPAYLCTSLDPREPLRIGDLQIKPRCVKRERVRVVVSGFTDKPEPCKGDSLVLYLDLKNLSTEYAFAPLDNYFDRCWLSGALPPFTFLEVGKHRFHGGPAKWYPLSDRTNRREWVEGRKDLPDVLQPGEEKQFFVCTNGDDVEATESLFGDDAHAPYHGSFLWRVRVRRGLVRFENKNYPATAVIGVRFTDKDIQKAEG
jgi:DNA-directed RNA polymerase subunit RPC12/RpoP